MADARTERREPEYGFAKMKEYIISEKIDFAIWVLRTFCNFLIVAYFIPIFENPYTFYYKAFMCHASASALRLHQRLPQVQFTKEFLQQLLLEDSCHYLFYCIIFLYIAPVTSVALQPVFFFNLIQTANYTNSFLNVCFGSESFVIIKFGQMILLWQWENVLKLISFTEIFLMPISILLLLIGHASLLTPFLYYQFLCMRYLSRRNPYTKNLFHQMRLFLENMAGKPRVPPFVRQALLMIVSVTCRLGPTVHTEVH